MKMTGKFSFGRVWCVARLHGASLLLQLSIYAAISLAVGLLFVATSAEGEALLLLPLVGICYYVMIGLGALPFASSRGLEMRTVLPASGWEKTVAILGHSLVAVPLAVILPFAVCYAAGYNHMYGAGRDMPYFLEMVDTYMSVDKLFFIGAGFFLAAISLWIATGVRRNRAVLSVIGVGAGCLLLWLSNMVKCGLSLMSMYEDGRFGRVEYHVDNNGQLYSDLRDFIISRTPAELTYEGWELAVMILGGMAMVILAIRNIRNRQL